MNRIAENLWTLHLPLRLFGAEHGRVVTVVKLQSGDLVIHTTARFGPAEVKAISAQGRPRWLVDAALLHDTFAKEGKAAFPELPLLAPPGFSEVAGVSAAPLFPAPPEWAGELEVLELAGMPKVREHVMLHRSSRTLIVADFVFNYNYLGNPWERFMRRWLLGLKHQPGITRAFRFLIHDLEAFRASVARMMEWDFDRIICGHKEVVEQGAKEKIRLALRDAGI